ncbi:MAG TPA: hypothetical protein VFB27_05525 [Opitutaceae bacterium]|nr:hypothetical protein [Opitutaceae bacterium]
MKPNPRWTIARYVLFPLAVLMGFAMLFGVSARRYPAYVAVTVGVIMLVGCLNAWRIRTKNAKRGWRCRRRGRDEFVYSELVDGKWMSIFIGGEMLMGKPRHRIYLPTEEEWSRMPGWAKDRRAEIVTRMKLEYPEPEYVYQTG